MLIIKGLFFLFSVIILAIFFAQNNSQVVDIKFLTVEYLAVPLYYVMIASFTLGIAFSMIFAGIREIKFRTKISKLGNDLKARDKEISELRTMPLLELDAKEEKE